MVETDETMTRRRSLWKCLGNKRVEAADRQTKGELDAALMQATVDGDINRVQRLTSQGANRHLQHSTAMLDTHVAYERDAFDTPLEAASWLGHTDIVRFFLRQQRSSRRLILGRNSRRNLNRDSPELVLDQEAFLVACQGGPLEIVQCFVDNFGSRIVEQEYQNVTPLHYACARCHLPMIQYLVARGGRLDTRTQRGGVTPVHWLGLYVEMKRIHGNEAPPIPLPENDDLTEESYESALAWIIQNYPEAVFAPDNRGTTALQRLLKKAPLGLIRTAVVHLMENAIAGS